MGKKGPSEFRGDREGESEAFRALTVLGRDLDWVQEREGVSNVSYKKTRRRGAGGSVGERERGASADLRQWGFHASPRSTSWRGEVSTRARDSEDERSRRVAKEQGLTWMAVTAVMVMMCFGWWAVFW